jgi:glycosyltransferase involved in cell wall biosynthesis
MKKVLIIAHLFYASPRIPGLGKYLPEFGWQPIVLTTPLGEDPDSRFGPPDSFKSICKVIETHGYISSYGKKRLAPKKYRRLKRVLRFFYRYYREVAQYPDSEKGWKPFAVKVGDELFQSEEIDAMISSYSPVTSHLIASELKRKHGVPWVADFRDLWTQNHNYPYSPLRKIFERRLELKTLSVADALVSTSQFWADKVKAMHRKEAYAITNGFDPDSMSDGKADLTANFTITYTGQIYTKQDPTKLLIAIEELISQGKIDQKDVEVRFYGPENELLQREIEKRGLSKIVKQYGTIPRQDSFKKQQESQLLLLLDWEDPQEKGVFTGKIFEYFAAQRPILATGGFGDDVVEKALDQTNSGVYCLKLEDIKDALEKLYSEYKLKGRIAYHGNIEEVNKYSYREMARKFAEILNNLTAAKQT